jgi:hypothetical protein
LSDVFVFFWGMIITVTYAMKEEKTEIRTARLTAGMCAVSLVGRDFATHPTVVGIFHLSQNDLDLRTFRVKACHHIHTWVCLSVGIELKTRRYQTSLRLFSIDLPGQYEGCPEERVIVRCFSDLFPREFEGLELTLSRGQMLEEFLGQTDGSIHFYRP